VLHVNANCMLVVLWAAVYSALGVMVFMVFDLISCFRGD
jgi:hypothetical protein